MSPNARLHSCDNQDAQLGSLSQVSETSRLAAFLTLLLFRTSRCATWLTIHVIASPLEPVLVVCYPPSGTSSSSRGVRGIDQQQVSSYRTALRTLREQLQCGGKAPGWFHAGDTSWHSLSGLRCFPRQHLLEASQPSSQFRLQLGGFGEHVTASNKPRLTD